MQSEISPDDLVVFKEGKNIMSGGYKIDSLFLKNNIPPMTNNNSNIQKGGDFTSLFSNLAVPAGLLLLQQNTSKNKNLKSLYSERKVIDSSLHDKLLEHVNKNKRIHHNRKTKSNKKILSNKTRKNT